MAFDQLATLASLRGQVRLWADMPSPARPLDADLNTLINSFAKRLYGSMVTMYEDYYLTTSANITIPTGTDNVDLSAVLTGGAGGSSDFFKLVGVDYFDGSNWRRMRSFATQERNDRGHGRQRYRLEGSILRLTPTTGPLISPIRVLYIPKLPLLVNDGDALDGVNGWEILVVLDCARMLRRRDEEDTAAVDQEYQLRKAELEGEMASRDTTEPVRVVDVHGRDEGYC